MFLIDCDHYSEQGIKKLFDVASYGMQENTMNKH